MYWTPNWWIIISEAESIEERIFKETINLRTKKQTVNYREQTDSY